MIVLYRGGGSGDFELSGPALSSDGWQRLMRNVCRLLEPRGQPRAAELLRSFPFEVMDATNHFAPSRSVLSRLPETMCVPSGLKATLDTEPSCPCQQLPASWLPDTETVIERVDPEERTPAAKEIVANWVKRVRRAIGKRSAVGTSSVA
jgi:hypothetical protein